MYEVPERKKSVDQDKFQFKIGAKEYYLPRLKFLTGRALIDLSKVDDIEGMYMIAPNKTTKEALLDLQLGELEGLLKAWNEDSGVTLPESEASAS